MKKNHSLDYAKSCAQVMNTHGQREIWNKFIEIGTEFPGMTDFTESKKLAKRYRCKTRECFDNCRRIALLRNDLSYYEGHVTTIIPIDHAWLVNEKGEVLEPTLCLLEDMGFKDQYPPVDFFGMKIERADLLTKNNFVEPLWAQVIKERMIDAKRTESSRFHKEKKSRVKSSDRL